MSDSSESQNDHKSQPPTVGGDHLVIHGNVGPGASIGRGYVHADHIAGRDLTIIGNSTETNTDQDFFFQNMDALRQLIVEARESGDMSNPLADQALQELASVAEIAAKSEEEVPGKKDTLIQRLKRIADIVESAADVLDGDKDGQVKVIKALFNAVPIVLLLIRVADRIF